MTTQPQGSVLSSNEIKALLDAKQLILQPVEKSKTDWYDDGLRGDGFDLRVGWFISKRLGRRRDGDGKGPVFLNPGEMAVVVSMERLEVPLGLTGMVVPRDKPAHRGLLMLNAGHVDPGWKGHLTGIIVNLSDQDRSVKLDEFKEGIFSVVFSRMTSEAGICPKNFKNIDEQLREIESKVMEQQGTLLISERVMAQRYVSNSDFTPKLWRNVFAFISIVGVIAGVLVGIIEFTDFSFTVSEDKKPILLINVLIAILIGVLGSLVAFEVAKAILRWVKKYI